MNNFQNSTARLPHKLGLSLSPTGDGWFKLIHHQVDEHINSCNKSCKSTCSTSFLYLIEANSKKLWHKFQSSLVINFIGGAPILLKAGNTEQIQSTIILGNDFSAQSQPTCLVGASCWTRMSTTGDWSLLSCTYSAGFEFQDIKIAHEDWAPGRGEPQLSFPGEVWAPRVAEPEHAG